ncbi:hypothetical protein [Pseudonocardia sp. NPDC049635]|uniref:hypothetical protein n=1 Tax=Pseudonocardia sp. NPDC049635 TaxID=3155506 RepID=UPI00340AB628
MREIEIVAVPAGRVRVLPDDASPSPREQGGVGHLVLDVDRYDLPWEDHTGRLRQLCERGGWRLATRYLTVFCDAVVLPVWGYTYGELALRAGTRSGCFADPWDSEQAGLAYLLRNELAAACGGSYPGDDHAHARLRGEVETYDLWSRGQVVGYIAERWEPCPTGTSCTHTRCSGGDWTEIKSCWGVYGISEAITCGRTTLAEARAPR